MVDALALGACGDDDDDDDDGAGDNLRAEGPFDDERTPEQETVEGTLEAVCVSNSRR